MVKIKNAKSSYNILYTTPFSHMVGGGQWSLYYLIKHLNKEVFHPIVLCPEEGELAERMRTVDADVIFLRMGRLRHLNPFIIWKLVSIMKKQKIHLVHTDSSTETFYAGISARLMGIPLVWHIRASEGEWFLDRPLSLLSTRLVLVAEALGQRFGWLKNSPKLAVIRNAIDINEFDASSLSYSIRREFNIGEDEILLGCIGRVEERKGQEHLLSAIKDVGNVKLILAGEEEKNYYERVKTLCRGLGISDRVVFAGRRDDIPSLLKGIDILILPTLTEGFSRVILEAMAAAKPVIATDVGGNSEAVVDGITGYIVPPKDAEALADKIDELVNSKEKREEMGRAGRKRVEEMFTIEKNVREVERLYEEILGIPPQKRYCRSRHPDDNR